VGVWQNPGFVNVFLLRSEQLFILVHTEAHPGGEIRGDIRARTVALKGDSWGAVKALYEGD